QEALRHNKKLEMARIELENKKIEAKESRLLRYPRLQANASLFYWYHTERTTTLPVALTSLPIINDIPPIPFETQVMLTDDHYFSVYASSDSVHPLSLYHSIASCIT